MCNSIKLYKMCYSIGGAQHEHPIYATSMQEANEIAQKFYTRMAPGSIDAPPTVMVSEDGVIAGTCYPRTNREVSHFPAR